MFDISVLFPLTSAIFILSFGVYIYMQKRQDLMSGVFFLLTLLIAIFLFATAMLLYTHSEDVLLFWERIIYSAVVFIPPTVYFLSAIFVGVRSGHRIVIFIGYTISTFFLWTVIFTSKMIDGVYQYLWGFHAQAQYLHSYFLAFFAIYLILMFGILMYFHTRSKDTRKKKQAKFLIVALLVLATGSIAFLPAYGISILPAISYAPNIFFVVIMAYVIAEQNLLNARLFMAQFFVFYIALIALINIAISGTLTETIVNTTFLIVICFFGYGTLFDAKNKIKQRNYAQKLVKRLRVANKRLVEIDKEKSEAISVAAHQLRTPLTAMKGFLSLVMEEEGDDKISPDVRQQLAKVNRATNRLARLVNNLLNSSRIDEGRMQYEFEPQQFELLVHEIAELFYDSAEGHGLQLILDLPDKRLSPIIADDSLREVISNLIDNAIKYSTEGAVMVSVTQPSEKFVLMSVKDNGVGIDKETVSKLFSKFTRADTAQLNSEGSGLGLYVCYNIVNAHNGRIWVESNGAGKGSTFFVEIPVFDPDNIPDSNRSVTV